eukprot:1246088-Amphidinium_carterae.1
MHDRHVVLWNQRRHGCHLVPQVLYFRPGVMQESVQTMLHFPNIDSNGCPRTRSGVLRMLAGLVNTVLDVDHIMAHWLHTLLVLSRVCRSSLIILDVIGAFGMVVE